MNAARLDRSPRLQATLAYLRERGHVGATTLEIVRATDSCAVHSDVAELRANGITVGCAFEGVRDGRRVYRYTVTELPADGHGARRGA